MPEQKTFESNIRIAICLMVLAKRFEQIAKVDDKNLDSMQMDFEEHMESMFPNGGCFKCPPNYVLSDKSFFNIMPMPISFRYLWYNFTTHRLDMPTIDSQLDE